MKLLYRLGVFLIRLCLPLIGVISPKIVHFLKGRKGLFDKLAKFKQSNPGQLVWIHVASLGEYEQAKPVIEELKSARPKYKIVVSFFSPSGYDNVVKKAQEYVDYVTYIPLDSRRNAVKFIKILDPVLVFFVKYDLWYNHLNETKAREIPLYLISAAFRRDQIYFKKIPFFRNLLFRFDQIFTQNQSSLDLLKTIGYQNGVLTGDTRFDRIVHTAKNPKQFPEIALWAENYPVLVAGSVWQEDMNLLITLMNANDTYKWIIAPHSLDPAFMSEWESKLKIISKRYSKWDKNEDCQALFIDNIGMLSSLYQFSYLSYIGGAFGKGLHNILEPIGFGSPVIFGKLKKASKFPEAAQSQLQGCGFEVKDLEELEHVFQQLQNSDFYNQSKAAAIAWVEANQGASGRIIEKIHLID
jgi:3-deoxy-D-manno-octulosonic-acid transferase